MRNVIFLAIIFLFALLSLETVLADFQLNQDEVQLSVAGILLDVETKSTIDEMAFYGTYLTVTLSANQNITISSADRRNLEVTPRTFVSITCSGSESRITIDTDNILQNPITYTITPGSGTCVISGGGGGAPGSTGGPGVSTPSVPLTILKPPEEKEEKECNVPEGEVCPPTHPLAIPESVLVPPPPISEPPIAEPTQPEEPTPPLLPPITEPIKEAVKDITQTTKEVSKGIVKAVKSVAAERDVAGAKNIIQDLRADPVVTNTIKKFIEPFLVVLAAVGAAIMALTAIQASAAIAINVISFLQTLGASRFYILPFVRFKKRNPWGKVIEKWSNKPVQAALVQIYDAEFKKLKDTQLTDKEGRFGALVGPGKYFVRVSKNGFQDKETEVIEITSPKQVLNLEIIITLIQEAFGLEELKKINLFDVVKKFLDAINPVLLIIGTIISLIALIIVPSLLNYILFSIYILFDILKIYFAVHYIKPFGKVLDASTQTPLALAIVRVFNEEKNLLLATKAADDEGRFNFLLAPGKYYLTCLKSGYAPFRSGSIELTKAGITTLDIKLEKQ